jgi:hypothetical protein
MRRHPILGTAAVVGASRASAKHEVEKQTEAQARREWEVQREVEQRNRQKAEEDARIQRATEQGMKAQAASYAPSAPNVVPPPSYPAQNLSGPGLQPASMPVRDMQNARYCPACGNACEMLDRFCRTCGTRQA